MKTCPKCAVSKAATAFGTRKLHGKIYTNSWCKECRNRYNREWHAARPKTAELRRAQKRHKLKHRFGISLEQYEAMLLTQNGVCAICRTKPDQKDLAVDHNHITGKIRGLLCSYCNTGIGHLKDSPLMLRTAANYLERQPSA